MRMPADCVLLNGLDVTVDESPYFEDRETIVEKSLSLGSIEYNNHTENPDPFLLTNSLVLTGSGKAVVCAVGKQCRLSEIESHEKLEDDENFTPL